jgi:lipoprotein-releasing system ATP-binding protein
MPEPIIELEDATKQYEGAVVTRVLHGISFAIQPGEFVALVGPSGSGKSTLLNIIGLLDRATSGLVRMLGQNVAELDDPALTQLRGRSLGFVFQFHHLVSALTAVENLQLPLAVATGRVKPETRRIALNALDEVGLTSQADKLPREMSGGQQQRVAIARAIVHRPPLVLADEPTGNLDTETANSVFDLLRRYNRESGTAFLIVTHDTSLAARCDRMLHLVDGRLSET